MNKQKVRIKGTITKQATTTKSNAVVSELKDANGREWQLVAFNRSPHAQKTLTNVDVVGLELWIEGTLGKNPFNGKPEIVVNDASVDALMMDEALAAISAAGGTVIGTNAKEPVTVDIPIPDYF